MYVFFDIDNTLVSHVGGSHVPESTLKALKLLRRAGHTPVIATGRPYFLTQLLADYLKIKYLVCANGAELIINKRRISKKFIPPEFIKDFYEVAKKFPNETILTDGEYFYTNGDFVGAENYFNSQAGYECVKELNHDEHIKRALICYLMLKPENLNPEHGIFDNPPHGVKVEPMHHFIEARNPTTSKWSGIQLLTHKMKAKLSDVVTFGDGVNDIEMIKNAKIGVAVGKSESVRAVADYVVDDIDDGGILKACYDLDLIRDN